MKRALLGLILAVATVVTAVLSTPEPAAADHNRFLPGLPHKTMLRVLDRGYGLYCFNQSAYAYPNFRVQIQTVYADEAARVGIPWYEDTSGQNCDVIHNMVNSSAFPCGAGAAACIYYTNDPVTVFYLSDLLYYDWKSTQGHEHGHWDGSHERYKDSGGIQCTRQTYTRMDCGSGVWWVTDYDLFVAWNVMVPDAPMNVGFRSDGNWATVTWDNYRADCRGFSNLYGNWLNIPAGGPAHPSCKNDVATRVAFGWAPYDGAPIAWAGEFCGPTYNYCYTGYTHYTRSFDTFWKGCLYLRAENTALWWVPQVSAPNYWTKAGCW